MKLSNLAARPTIVAPVDMPVRAAGAQIISVVCVVGPKDRQLTPRISSLHAALSDLGPLVELVVVLNGSVPDIFAELRDLAERLHDVQIYAIRQRVDSVTALVAGLENAVGDWVATVDLAADHPTVIGRLFERAIAEQCDVALTAYAPVRRGPVDVLLSGAFHRLFRMLHGFSLAAEASTARLLSRSVVNDLLRHDSPLVAVETLTATAGYRRCTVQCPRSAEPVRSLAERVRVRWRTLIGLNAMPLRIANLICALGALAALAYSAYVVVIYLVRDDVMPGWTTVSLMLSGMFLMFSLVLGLLSEYILMLLDSGARRARYEISSEFRSPVQLRTATLNVESEL